MMRLWTEIQSRLASDEGASLVEYALLVALIAVVAIVAINLVGSGVSSNFSEIADEIN